MAFEYQTVRNVGGENIINWLEQGWEILNSYIESTIETHNIQEELPQYSTSASQNTYGYNRQTQYIVKQYPVAVPYTVFILKRSMPAKVLYGQNDGT